MPELGRVLMLIGGSLFVVGLALTFAGRIPGLGHLPGDLRIEREHMTIFMPCGTMILVSLVLTVVLNLIARLWR
jgi:hypothetical protein